MSTRTFPARRTAATLFAAATIGLAIVGCHRPHGAFLSYPGGSSTYWSTESSPKTVRLIDTRTDEVIFAMDVPVGRQLTLQFKEGKGDDDVYAPDAMRYEVFDLGTETGKLRNQMSVPAAFARRLEVEVRRGPEYRSPSPDAPLRTDQAANRPDWWTSEGGPLPEDPRAESMYDR